MTANDNAEPLESFLLRQGVLCEFEVVATTITPTVGDDDYAVEIKFQLHEDDVERGSLGFMFTLMALSFNDARPRGISDQDFKERDELEVRDFLGTLDLKPTGLHTYLDYLRGRCVKTSIDASGEGVIVLQTVNRGQAATRWVDRMRGQRPVKQVPPNT